MIKNIIQFIEQLIIIGRGRIWFLYALALVLIIAPAVSIRLVNYDELKQDLSGLTLARRQSVAVSVAEALTEELHRIEDYTLTLTNAEKVQTDVAAGRWEDAISFADASLKLTVGSLVERIFITDAQGVLQADVPALPAVRGTNFSYREWYAGVVSTGKLFVSPVYKRTAEPQLNVVAVAAPILGDNNQIIGIIVTQVSLDNFSAWVQDITIGTNGFVYIVDQKGQVVAHKDYPPQAQIADFSSVTPVERVLQGKAGVQFERNPITSEDLLTAYAPVDRYGWAVLVQEPAVDAFRTQNETLQKFLRLEWTVGLWNLGVLIFMLAIIHRLTQYLLVQRQTTEMKPTPKLRQK